MDLWADVAQEKLYDLAAGDEAYRRLLQQLRAAEPGYLAQLQKLGQQERENLENYIRLCEALAHRRTLLAWELGRTWPAEE